MGKKFSIGKLMAFWMLILSAIIGCGSGGIDTAGTKTDAATPASKEAIKFSLVKFSDPNVATTSISPDSPAILKATATDSTGAVLMGKVMSFSSAFDIKFDPVSGTALTDTSGTAVITIRVGATAGAATITASIDSAGTVITGDKGITVNLKAPPAVPTGVTATAVSSSQISLTWIASAGAVGYKIYKGGILAAALAATAWTDTGLLASTPYRYAISAYDSGGNESDMGSQVFATTYGPPPAIPAVLAVRAISPTQIDLSWTASAGASQYKIYRNGVLLSAATATTYSDTFVVPDIQYSYAITAIDATGSESAQTAQSIANTGLTVPKDITATVDSSTQITLSWASSGGSLVQGYNIYKNGALLAAATATSLVDAGLTAMTSYCYNVSAADISGNESARSSTVCGTTSGSTTPPTSEPASFVNLLTSSPQVESDGLSTVTLTAIVKTAKNVALKDRTVTFASDSGTLVVTRGTTDASGTATATLSAAPDKSKRTITITAKADSITSQTSVDVIGTTLQITGQNSLVSGTSANFSLFLKDSAGQTIPGQNITLTSSLGNSFDQNPVLTSANGQAEVTYTAAPDVGGPDTVTASALGATVTQVISISNTDFTFTAPSSGAEINIGSAQAVTIHYGLSGVPQTGKTVNFSTTRGTIAPPSAITDGSGNASATLSSSTAGPAIITATIAEAGTIQLPVEFIAITVSSMSLQASPGTIATNTAGSTVEQSTIIAVLRDSVGNLVKNKTVQFSLTDVSGGYIKQASDVTNSQGMASTTYISSISPSDKDKVVINASVDAVTAFATLTVASKPIYVVFGTGNVIENYSSTQYRVPFVALVTDIAGNPRAGVTVTANLTPVAYLKGYYDNSGCPLAEYWSWTPALNGGTYLECANEDNNPLFFVTHPEWLLNGFLNSGGGQTEDINGDGVLTPGNVAVVNETATTDDDGFAKFYVIYAKQFANWVKVRIDGRIYSYGDQTLGTTQFYLPVLRADTACSVTPPGPISPFGLGTLPNNVCTNNQ